MAKAKHLLQRIAYLDKEIEVAHNLATVLQHEVDILTARNEKLAKDNSKLHSTLSEAYQGILNITHPSLYTDVKERIKKVIDDTEAKAGYRTH